MKVKIHWEKYAIKTDQNMDTRKESGIFRQHGKNSCQEYLNMAIA